MIDESVPWRTSKGLSPKPSKEGEYGYVDEKGVHGCTREELIAFFSAGKYKGNVPAWSPEHPDLLPPGEIPFLREAYCEGMRRRTFQLRPQAMAVFLALIGGLLVALGPAMEEETPGENWVGKGLGLIGIGIVMELIPRYRSWRRSRTLTNAQAVAAEGLDERYSWWIEDQAPDFSFWMWIGLAAVGICQVLAVRFDPLQLGGLKPSAVRDGEWWRVFTAALLHGGMIHFYMNWMAFESFATRIELALHRAYVPLVFLVSAIYGNLASVMLRGDDRISVGASGGILGLIGFMLIVARRHRAHLPPGFTRMTTEVIVLTALIGMVGYELIDNAGHAGGFMAGLLLGLALVHERPAGAEKTPPSRTVRMLGYAALAGLVMVVLLTIGVIFGYDI